MSNPQLEPIIRGFRELHAGWDRNTSIETMRAQWDAFLSAMAIPAHLEDVKVENVRCRWVWRGDSTRSRLIMFLHGGGYQIGSLRSHHNIMARLAESSGHHVLGVDYRLAPEHRFPAPIADALAVYEWLLKQGFRGCDISLCGDSAGGGLAVALVVLLKERKLPLPAAIVAMSPWADMEALGESFELRADQDPVTQRGVIQLMARTYLGKTGNRRDPLASPVHGDLVGLPPLLIQVGEREVLFDDAQTLAQRAQSAGVETRLSVWEGMIHTFQLFAGRLDAADSAIAEAARFLNEKYAHAAQRETAVGTPKHGGSA